MKKNIKIGLVSSKGGHLVELLQLKDWYKSYDHFWITFAGKDTEYYLKKEKKVVHAYFPESRNMINLLKNTFLAFKIFLKEKPTVLISCGAGIAIPFFIIGKIFFRIRLIYIESYDFISYPSMTGKILYRFSDLFLVQHKIQKKWYPNAKYTGSLL